MCIKVGLVGQSMSSLCILRVAESKVEYRVSWTWSAGSDGAKNNETYLLQIELYLLDAQHRVWWRTLVVAGINKRARAVRGR